MYTSLKLSKWLKEKGFEGEGDHYQQEKVTRPVTTYIDEIAGFGQRFKSYDILSDLGVKYNKEVFGTVSTIFFILIKMVENKPQEEIEEYIMANTILK